MEKEAGQIESITFGVYSGEEIKKMAVAKIFDSRLGNRTGGVYDPRLGTIENGVVCVTCLNDLWSCPGHWGYIDFNEPIIHPLYYKQVVMFLKCFCVKCYKMLISEDQINLYNFNRSKGTKRFNKIIEKLQKTEICLHCSHPQPEFKHIIADNVIDMVYKNKQKQKVSIHIQNDEIKKIFDNIENNDVRLLGFNPDLIHPRNLIITVFPVIPTCARPFVISDGNTSDDDLTIQLIEIIKANNHLEPVDGIPLSEIKKQKYLQTLNFRVSTYFNNSCLCPETPVLLWSGDIKRADEIKEGDELIGDDGGKRIVIHTCSGEDQMYEINQENAETYIVNKSHVLTLQFPNHKKVFWDEVNCCYSIEWYDNDKKDLLRKNCYITKEQKKEDCLKIMKEFSKYIDIPKTFDIKVSEYMKLPDTITNKFVGFRLSNSVLWDQKDVIDPHTLITILLDRNDNFNVSLNKSVIDKYNFEIDNKIIPDDYIYNNSNNRLELLASIVDEIGVIYDNGDRIEIETDTKYERLMNQIHFVSQSLGFFSKLEVFENSNKLKITLLGDDIISRVPTFFINYKKSKVSDMKKCKNKLLSKISVKPIGTGKYNGFIINGNHRFLLGDFTVTHNSGKSKHSTSGRVMKGIKERLTGKEGLIRMNLLGKRCEQSGRTVIGPEPTLKMGQLAIPPQMANNLTIPIRVNYLNYKKLCELLDEGKVKYILKDDGVTRINVENALFFKGTRINHGDIIIRKNPKTGEDDEILVTNGKETLQVGDKLKRNAEFVKDIKYPEKKTYSLNIGDICERNLLDGDWVLLNPKYLF